MAKIKDSNSNFYIDLYVQINRLTFFHNQPVYKRLALGWQIAKQLSGLNPISLSNNKNYR